jgi:hypothetical protein
VQRDTSPPSAPLAFFTLMMLLAPVTNWETRGVTFAGYCYAMRHGMKVQIVTPFRISHLQRYCVTVRGNVTSAYPPLIYNTIQFFGYSHVFRRISVIFRACINIFNPLITTVCGNAPPYQATVPTPTLYSLITHFTSLFFPT